MTRHTQKYQPAPHRHRWVEDTTASSMIDGWAYDCRCGAQKHVYIHADCDADDEGLSVEIIEAPQ